MYVSELSSLQVLFPLSCCFPALLFQLSSAAIIFYFSWLVWSITLLLIQNILKSSSLCSFSPIQLLFLLGHLRFKIGLHGCEYNISLWKWNDLAKLVLFNMTMISSMLFFRSLNIYNLNINVHVFLVCIFTDYKRK